MVPGLLIGRLIDAIGRFGYIGWPLVVIGLILLWIANMTLLGASWMRLRWASRRAIIEQELGRG